MKEVFSVLAAGMMLFAIGTGCSKSKVDKNKPVEQIQVEAQALSLTDLQAYVDAYQVQLSKVAARLEGLKKQVEKIPASELLSDKSKELKLEFDKVMDEEKALSERIQVYKDTLTKKKAAIK